MNIYNEISKISFILFFFLIFIFEKLAKQNNNYIGNNIVDVLEKISKVFYKNYKTEIGKVSTAIHGLREFYALTKFFSFHYTKYQRQNINEILFKGNSLQFQFQFLKFIYFIGILKELGGEKMERIGEYSISPTIWNYLKALDITITDELIQKYNVQQFIKENLFDRFEVSSSTSTPVSIFFKFSFSFNFNKNSKK